MTASADRLFSAIRGRTPCQDCKQRPNCAAKRLACADYSYYVNSGKVQRLMRAPSRRRYENIMRAEA